MKLFLVVLFGLVLTSSAYAKVYDFAEVTPEIYRGGIKGADKADLQFLKDHGVQTILNIRKVRFDQEAKEHKLALEADFNYIHAAVTPFATFLFPMPGEKKVDAVLADLVDPSIPKPIFLHCYTGEDRTGMIIALYRVLYQGWDVDTAYQKEMVAYKYRQHLVRLKQYLYKHSKNPAAERANIDKILAARQATQSKPAQSPAIVLQFDSSSYSLQDSFLSDPSIAPVVDGKVNNETDGLDLNIQPEDGD